MYVLFRIIVKEFLQIRRDRKMIPVIFVAPIVQILVFGFAVNTDVTNVRMVLVDQDGSRESRDLVARFVRSGYFEIVATEERASDIDGYLLDGRAQIGLVMASGFGQRITSRETAPVQIVVDGSDAVTTNVALGYAGALTQEYAVAHAFRRGASGVGEIRLEPRVLYNPDLRSRWFYVPAVLAMVLMIMTMLLTAMGIVREKEIGTMEQIIVTPVRPWQLIVGKLAPFWIIGVVQVFLVSGLAVLGFGVPLRGSFGLLLALTLLFLLSSLGLGLLISTLVENQQQAMMVAVLGAMVPMIYLSGLIFPIENMPPVIQFVTYAIPLRYYAEIIRGIFLRGVGLEVLWPEALVLLLMGSGILGLATLRFRKRLD